MLGGSYVGSVGPLPEAGRPLLEWSATEPPRSTGALDPVPAGPASQGGAVLGSYDGSSRTGRTSIVP